MGGDGDGMCGDAGEKGGMKIVTYTLSNDAFAGRSQKASG